jgi:uncharacterized protein (TIGR03437 family)
MSVPFQKYLILALLCAPQLFAQAAFRQDFTKTFGGSGGESITAIAVDSAGNVVVTGTTTSFDFPTVNAFQSTNNGAALMFSPDAGITWRPLLDQSIVNPATLAVDPTDPNTIYVGGADRVYKSTDGGQHYTFADLLLVPSSFGTVSSPVQEIAIDPHNPQILYSIRSQNGVAKSVDGGKTWTVANIGLSPNGGNTIRIDPLHPGTAIAWEQGPYRTTNGGQTWVALPVPGSCCLSGTGIGVVFDPFTPNVVYSNAPGDVYKSVDGGLNWAPLHVPFPGIIRFVADPSTKNTLYAVVEGANPPANNGVWRTTDGGATWQQLGLQLLPLAGPLAVDPANPKVLLSGSNRSDDAGVTWHSTSLSRSATIAFASNGSAYAIAPITTDAFVRKYDASGNNVIFSTYLGGQGGESATGLALDPAGNIYLTGTTTSVDFPATSGAYQTTLQGASDAYIAKLAPDGTLLYATFVGGAGSDSSNAIAVDSSGTPVIVGFAVSAVVATPAGHPFVTRLSADGSTLLYQTALGGLGGDTIYAVAIDTKGNAVITGQTNSSDFPITTQIFPTKPPVFGDSKAFVAKLSPSGDLFYSTYFGGVLPANNNELPNTTGTGIAMDAADNIYVAGYTSARDFPVTAGAYQPNLNANCPYPSSAIATGFIGTIFMFNMDDFFLTKISPDGSKALFSTFIGGNCYDIASALALDSNGNAFIAGSSDSSPFPLAFPTEGPPAYSDYKGVVAGLSSGGASLLFSTYTAAGLRPAIATGTDGSLYIGGGTGSQALLTKLARITTPTFSVTAAVNAFSKIGGMVAPGELVTLSLTNYDPGTYIDIGIAPHQSLETQLADTQVLFDGQPVYLLGVAPGQITCFVPSSLAGKSSTQVQVQFQGRLSNTLNVPVNPTALGLLSADGSGSGLANARNEDGSLNSATNPAAAGSLITLYFTGAGVTNPPEPDGMLVSSDGIQPVAALGAVDFVGSLPGFIPGLFQIRERVPAIGGAPNIAVSTATSSSQVLYYYAKAK